MAYNKKEKLQDNLQAINIAFAVARDGREATEQEKAALRKYSGFGGLKFILNPCEEESDIEKWSRSDRPLFPLTHTLFATLRANSSSEKEYKDYERSVRNSILTSFYTPKAVVDAIAKVIKEKGVDVKTYLDPSAGKGTFVESFKELYPDVKVSAFEKDLLTGKVLKALYPNEDIHVDGFETIDAAQQGRYDIVSSNIPFGDISVFDDSYATSGNAVKAASTKTIHNYFFLKALDQVREGGFVVFITSRGFMDSPSNNKIREEIVKNARLVGAYRLPDGMFRDEAGTDVGSDLVVLQKYSGYDATLDPDSLAFCEVSSGYKTMDGEDYTDFNLNTFWWKSMMAPDSEAIIATKEERGTDPYGKPALVFTHEGGMTGISSLLEEYMSRDLYSDFVEYYKKNAPKPQRAVEQQKPIRERPARQDQPVQLSLFDLWAEDTVVEEAQGLSMDPRPYKGDILPHYRNGIVIEDNGQLGHLSNVGYNTTFTPVELNDDQTGRMRLYIKIRDAYEQLYKSEAELRQEQPELREELNIHYDNFFVKYGNLNERKNAKLLMMDAQGRDVFSLENSENDKFVKADIFSRPVAFSLDQEAQVVTASDALSASLNRMGGVDLEYMVSISDFTEEELLDQLRERIYYNPVEGGYEIADRFLAGNVVAKLDSIRQWHGVDETQEHEIQRSIAALESVVPTPITYQELDFNFGERWMPKEYFSQFASEFFETDIKIDYAPQMDEFVLDVSGYSAKLRTEFAVTGETKTYDGEELLRHALYNTVPSIKKCVGYKPNGDPIMGTDHEKMQLAASKIDQIRDGFTEWIDQHPEEWKKTLADQYNRKFNCFVRASYDGSHQTFPGLDLKGLSAGKYKINEIYKSQKDCVWMLLQNNGGICDHEVGTGKTLTMCIAAHEMKRLGLAHKPIIIGMKANVAEIAATYQAAYPADRILYATQKDFADRQNFFNRMKNNDYDCIIMSHDQFTMIPQSADIQHQVIQEEINAIDEALAVYERQGHSVSGRMRSGLEKRKINLENQLLTLNATLASRADDVVDFKTMGIDHIFIDESQAFKNLAFTTRDNRVAGLGDPNGSQRARNLQYAIRTIQERTGKDLGATFLSGTTISNSLTELYLLFKYLRPQALSAQDINSFDAWAAVFARKSRDYEFNVAGNVVMKERYRQFIKVPELGAFYNEITDYKTAADVGLERPDMDVQLVNIQPTEDQQDFQQRLLQFAESGNGDLVFRGPLSDSEEKAKMLIVTNLGKKCSLSPKLVNPDYHEGDDTKIGVAAKNISEIYYQYNEQKGTQFVFCDLSTPKKGEWSAYQELKDRLVNEYHIPEAEIQFIQDAGTEKKKKEFIDKMNRGDIRVMIGSTTMLGTGVNAQQRAVAVHHLDLPWRPSDMEQRNGRARRKGNEVARDHADNTVKCFVYAVERSLDSYNFYLLQAKSEFIRQMKTGALGKRSFDQGGEDEDNGMPFAEYVAITSGNTDLLERAKLEKRILGLEAERKAFYKQQQVVQQRLIFVKEQIVHFDSALEKLHSDKAALEKALDGVYDDGIDVFEGIRRNNSAFAFHSSKDPQLSRVHFDLTQAQPYGDYMQKVARQEVNGEVIVARLSLEDVDWPLVMTSKTEYNPSTGVNRWVGNKISIVGASGLHYTFNNGKVSLSDKNLAANYPFEALSRIPEIIKDQERQRKSYADQIPELERIASKEWEKSEHLKELKEQLQTLDRKIQHDMDGKVQQIGQQPEVMPFIIEQKSWGRNPWELKFAVSDYPYLNNEDRESVEEKYHGSISSYHGNVTGHFRHQFGAEEAMKELSKLNAEHKDNIDWLKAAVTNVHDTACLPALHRLHDLGYDRHGRPLEGENALRLNVVSLGEYQNEAIRALAHGVKDNNGVAMEAAAGALAKALQDMPGVKNAVLVGMPGHQGYGGPARRLAKLVSEQTGILYVDALDSTEHESLYDWKKQHPGEELPELFFSEDRDNPIPEGTTPIIVDNVIDTGHTAWAAVEALEVQPILLTIGSTGNEQSAWHDIQVAVNPKGMDYIKSSTPAGVGLTGLQPQELNDLLLKAQSENNSTARASLRRVGLDWYTGQPRYLVNHIVDKWNVAFSDDLEPGLNDLFDKGSADNIFSKEELKHLSDVDKEDFNLLLSQVQELTKNSYSYQHLDTKRRLMIVYDYLKEKTAAAIQNAAAEQTVLSDAPTKQEYTTITDAEWSYMSQLVSDLNTGNHLLGRPRSEEYKTFFAEVARAHEAVQSWTADSWWYLTKRQGELLRAESSMYHDGLSGLASFLEMDVKELSKKLDVAALDGAVEEKEQSTQLLYNRESKSWSGVPADMKVYSTGEADRIKEVYGYTPNNDIDLVYNEGLNSSYVRVWVDDHQAETPAKIVIQLEQEGYDVGLHGERGRYVDFDSWDEAVSFEKHVRDIETEVHRPKVNVTAEDVSQESIQEEQDTSDIDMKFKAAFAAALPDSPERLSKALVEDFREVLHRAWYDNDLDARAAISKDYGLDWRYGVTNHTVENVEEDFEGIPDEAYLKTANNIISQRIRGLFDYQERNKIKDPQFELLESYFERAPKEIEAKNVEFCREFLLYTHILVNQYAFKPKMEIQQMISQNEDAKNAESPIMKQFHDLKAKYPDALLLFRVGEFYECYEQDAVDASRILGIHLVHRQPTVPYDSPNNAWAGFPKHALDTYLPKLVRAGKRVAICDQLEDPKKVAAAAQQKMKEEVTPGTRMQLVETMSDVKAVLPHQAMLRDALIERMREAGVKVNTDVSEGERVLSLAAGGRHEMLKNRIEDLRGAEKFIEEALKGKKVNKSIELDLPLITLRRIKVAMGRNYDSHSISANNLIHGRKGHGVGRERQSTHIPLKDEDFKLAPYIMIAPDVIIPGTMGSDGRESIRFEKYISNGIVVVVEKEQKNSPDDMETITMWADKSTRVADVRISTSPVDDVRNVISDKDAAKIRKDAETAIENDEIIRQYKLNFQFLDKNPNDNNIIVGEEAQRIYGEILESEYSSRGIGFPAHTGALGIFVEDGKYVAFDNSTNDCWVEDFKNEQVALSWLRGELSAEDAHKLDNIRLMMAPSSVSQPMFFRVSNQQAYGFVYDNEIYVDRSIATEETPLHEYTHLWSEVLRQQNPKEWENIVSLMKGNRELWQDVTQRYSHLTDENDIAEEVLAHYSGKRGFDRMEEEYKKRPGLSEENASSILDTLSEALSRLWSFVSDFLHIHYTSKEQVADQILCDALNGINPLDYRTGDAEKVSTQIIRPHFIGETGARNLGLSRGDGFMFMSRLLESAKDYEKRGYDALRIKQITGWERGADGKWRSEISGIHVKSMDVGVNTVLSDIVDAPDLFKAYPELEDVQVKIGGIFDNGQYDHETNTITLNEIYRSSEVTKEQYEEVLAVNEQSISDVESSINAGIDTEYNKSLLEELHLLKESVGEQAASARSIDEIWPDINSVMAHEVQHVIQHIEGFAVGGNLRTVANMRLESAQAEMDKYQAIYDEFKLLEDKSLYTDNISEVMYYIREMDKFEAEHGDELVAYRAARACRDAAEIDIASGMLSEKNFDEYRRLAGEVEARNVSRRAEMTAMERRNTLASATEDVARENQILRYGNLGVAAQASMPVASDISSRQTMIQRREAAGVMVDHLRAMGIDVVTDNHESRRTLREAEKDQSEAGKVRHFKTENGESYGFAYRGKVHLDIRRLNTELSLHEFAHLWCEAMRRVNPQNWSNTVAVIKNDTATWNFVKSAYPELKDENDVVEEVIARYSGKRGAEKLEAELQRMTPKDANYGSRWGNIFQNISKAIQDFWKHTGDSLNVEYKNADDVADMILKDFAQKISPVKKLEKYLQEQDKEYAAAVAAGNMDKARDLFIAALQENVGNGVTPFVAVDGYRGKMDQLARNVKSDDFAVWREAVNEAADRMAPLIDSFAPDKAVLVPAPSHDGKATNMLPLANAISHRTGIVVADVLVSEPRQSQYEAKRETGKPLTSEQLGIRMEGELPQGKLPIVIDNVVNSGNTAEACIKALGKGMVLSVASATSQERHVASLKSAAAVVYDKQGNLIPLSERFEIKNKWLGRVMNYKPDQQQTVIAGLEGYSEQEVYKYVREHFETMLEDSGIDAEIVDMKVIGSRVNGNSGEGSDLDVLLEFKGNISEDGLFNILNDEDEGRLYIEGIPVDINPITEGKSGTIQQFLDRNKDYVKEIGINDKNDFTMEENEKLQATIKDVTSRDEQFRYQLLNRMQQDCDYFLGNGNRHEGGLWAGNVKDQVAVMRALWDSVPEKPEWLSKELLDNYAEKMTTPEKSLQERLADAKTELLVLTDMYGLQYTPVILPQRVFVADDNHLDGEVSYGNATVMGSDVELYDSILDSYDARNGVSLSELPEDKQLDVLEQLRDKLQNEDRQLSVYVNTEQVPSYALSAIINDDFSGIEDDEDRQDIEDFMDKYAGMTFSVREEEPSFTNSPAFGKAVDCVPVDIINITTTGQLRQVQLARMAKGQQVQISQGEAVQEHVYTPEESAIIKEALGDHLQKVTNDYYNNGDVESTEIKEKVNGMDFPSKEQAKSAAYNISREVLEKAEASNPGIIARYTGFEGDDAIEKEATRMSQAAMKYAEAVLYNKQNNMEQKLEDEVTSLNNLVKEYNEVCKAADPNYDIFSKPVQFYSIEKNDDDHFALIAHDAETGKFITSWESARTIDSKIGLIRFELSAQMPALRDVVAERQNNATVLDPEFREAKGHMDDVISEALPNVDDKIEISPTTVSNGDDTYTITSLYHEQVDGQHHFLASSKMQDVTVDVDTVIHDVSSANELVTAIREAQIAQLLGTGGIDFIQRYKEPKRIENDSLTREAVYIREIQSRDGKVTIEGAIDNDGVPVYIKNLKDLGRDGIDNLFAEVRDVVQWTPELNLTIDQALMVAEHHGLHSEVELDLMNGMEPELALQKHHIMPTADMLAKIEQMNDVDQVPIVDAVPMLLDKVIPNDGDELLLDAGGAKLDFQYIGFGYQQLEDVKSIKHIGDGYVASNCEQTIDVSRLASGPDGEYFLKVIKDNVKLMEDKVMSEEKKQDAVQEQQEQQPEQKKKGWNIDYTKYSMPEGVNVEKAQVFKLDRGENAGKYAVSAVIDGQRKTQVLYKNDVDAYFSKDEQGERKATAAQLVAKYFNPETLKKSVPVKDDAAEKQIQEQKATAEQKPEETAASQQQEQSEQKKKGWNIDYTKYSMPEGAVVEKAFVKKDEESGKYRLMATINGEFRSADLYPNDRQAFFEKNEQGERKATVDQLVAKYFSKSTAEKMGKSAADIDSVGELENAAAEAKENVAEEQAASEKEEKERQDKEAEEKKQEEEQKKEDKQDVSAGLALQTTLLVGALQAVSEHDGVWMNKGGKQAPAFWPKDTKPSAFNSMIMALHSDANGYKTNMYTTFATAKREGISVRGKEKGLPFNWDDWNTFENKYNKNDVIDRAKYLSLDPQEKELYKVQFRKEMKPIFNIDQTTLPMTQKEAYNALVQVEEKKAEKSDQQVVKAEQVAEVKANYPDAMMLFREDKNYVIYGDDAKKAASTLGLSLVKPDGEDVKTENISVVFPVEELDSHLPKLIREGNRVAICDDIESSRLHQLTPVEEVYGASERLYASIANTGSVVVSGESSSRYIGEKDILNLSRRPAAVPGQEMTQAMEYANDVYRAAVAYTGTSDRLNRGSRMNILPEDRDKYERLVQELAAGVMMSRQGLPATISKDNRELIPYWERELKEDPKLLDAVERDVNKAIQVLDKISAGEKVDYAVLRGERQMGSLRPRMYTIASELATIPNIENKQVVVVRDQKNKSAAVILPAGASLEMNNEVPGMNKNRFVIALHKEGIDDVKFYNAGGALGLNQPNEFFADKEVEVAHLKQYELVQDETIDLSEELSRSSQVDIEKFSAIKNDKNEWVFYVKPVEGESVTIKPEAADLGKFFSSIQTEKFDAVREEMGQKYYALAKQHPELKEDFLMPKVENIDLDRIKQVHIQKDKYDENKMFVTCLVDDQRMNTRIDRDGSDWQRFWLVDDKNGYKVALAAKLFEAELNKGQEKAVVETQEAVLTKTEEVVVDNDHEEVEEEQQTQVRTFHR